jgi:hypothetical protein
LGQGEDQAGPVRQSRRASRSDPAADELTGFGADRLT